MIKRLIDEYAPLLETPEGICAPAILWAIYECERYPKHQRFPRFERAYAPGGYYYETSPLVRKLYKKWGAWTACSYSDFQILFVTAVELGYEGPPLPLDCNSVAIPYVVKYVNHRIFERGATTPEEVADAYNSGNHTDPNVPHKYIRKFRRSYDFWSKKLCADSTKGQDESTSGSSPQVKA